MSLLSKRPNPTKITRISGWYKDRYIIRRDIKPNSRIGANILEKGHLLRIEATDTENNIHYDLSSFDEVELEYGISQIYSIYKLYKTHTNSWFGIRFSYPYGYFLIWFGSQKPEIEVIRT